MACSICGSILSLSMGTCRPRKRGRAGTPLCVLLFQYCLLSFLPPSTSCLDHRGFAAPPRPALFRDSRSTAWAFVNGFGVCRRQNAMKTVMNREEYWGKKQAGAWERDLQLKESKITPGGIICHPCAHLAWSTNIPTDPAQHELLNVGELSEPPGVVDFKRLNSVQRTVALHVDWNHVMQLAMDLPTDAAAGRINVVSWSSTTDSADPCSRQLQVADTVSIELALAHALLDRSVQANVVAEIQEETAVCFDLSKLPPSNGGVPRSDSRSSSIQGWTPAMREGWTEMEEHGKVVIGMLDPTVVAHSRDNETPCWPKVWRFAKRMRAQQLHAWTGPSGFGEVPLKWDASLHRWHDAFGDLDSRLLMRTLHCVGSEQVAGNRHRLLAALLAGLSVCTVVLDREETRLSVCTVVLDRGETGVPFQARCRSQQVVEWGVRAGEDGEQLKCATKIVSFAQAS